MEALFSEGLLLESGVSGVYGRSAAFERVRMAFERLVGRMAAAESAEVMHFPPVLPRQHLETAGYLSSFPHLAGTVFAFDGDEASAREQADRARRHEDWSEFQTTTDLVLVPAACYPVYPVLAARGPLGAAGVFVDAGGGWVFRHEPSRDPARLQSFHQRELVRAGPATAVFEWRRGWCRRGVELLRSLGLEASLETASDPFFGRGGALLASSQREQGLKLEAQALIAGSPTAIASFNYHEDHFAAAFGLRLEDGTTAHTACVGFGEERITLALFRAHGTNVDSWPAGPRRLLQLGG